MNSVSFWTVSEKKLPFHSNTYKGRLNVLRCEIRHLRILLVFYKSFFEADLSSDISLRAMSVVANRLMYDPSSFIKIIAYSSLIWQWWSAKYSGDIFTAKVNTNCIACSVDRGLTKYRCFARDRVDLPPCWLFNFLVHKNWPKLWRDAISSKSKCISLKIC